MTIRRTLLAALWGMPGPLIAGCLIALASALMRTGTVPGSGEGWGAVFEAAVPFWWVVVSEAIAGGVYGLMRSVVLPAEGQWCRADLIHATSVAVVIWIVAGTMPFFLMAVVANIFWASRREDAKQLVECLFLGCYALHVFGGAVAGYHVEHFLLRTRETEGG